MHRIKLMVVGLSPYPRHIPKRHSIMYDLTFKCQESVGQ